MINNLIEKVIGFTKQHNPEIVIGLGVQLLRVFRIRIGIEEVAAGGSAGEHPALRSGKLTAVGGEGGVVVGFAKFHIAPVNGSSGMGRHRTDANHQPAYHGFQGTVHAAEVSS